MPSRHASREELLELYSVVGEFEGTAAELLPGVEATDETYELLTQVSLAARRPVNWNVLARTTMRPEEAIDIEMKLGASDFARERGASVVARSRSRKRRPYESIFSAGPFLMRSRAGC